MFKGRGQKSEKNKPETEKLGEEEFNIVKEGLETLASDKARPKASKAIEDIVMAFAQPQSEAIEEKTEKPAPLLGGEVISNPAGATAEELLEQHFSVDGPVGEETEPNLLKQTSQSTYTGEVELALDVPVDLKIVSRLYNGLQTIPELRILSTRGSVKRGIVITVTLDRPLPLISVILSKIPGLKAIPESSEEDKLIGEKLSSLSTGRRKGVKRVKLASREI